MKNILLKCVLILIIFIAYTIINKNFNQKKFTQEIILENDSVNNYEWNCVGDDKFLSIVRKQKNDIYKSNDKNDKYIFELTAKKEGITEVKCIYKKSSEYTNSNIVKIYNVEINSRKKIVINGPKEYNEFNFDTAYGNIKIVANSALTSTGFAGSSNTIFYLKDNNLYLYVHNGEDELLATSVDKIYYKDNQQVITAILNKNSSVIKEISYVVYEYQN